MKRLVATDLRVYLLSGLLSVIVFATALLVLDATLPGGLGRRRLSWFVTGFLLFVAVYVVAMWIYREIEAREGNVRERDD